MDFNDTKEEAEFRDEARAFLKKHASLLEPGETGGGFMERDDPDLIKKSQEWQATKKDSGWAVLTWPKEFGGRDVSSIQNVIWNQEEGKFATPPNVFGIGLESQERVSNLAVAIEQVEFDAVVIDLRSPWR